MKKDRLLKFSDLRKVIDPYTNALKVFIDEKTVLQISAPEYLEMARMGLDTFQQKNKIPASVSQNVKKTLSKSFKKKRGRPPKNALPVVATAEPPKQEKKRGRPKGSKNSPKALVIAPMARKRGRPKGSKNKPKNS